ncbi:uncharacterized protein LOC106451216 isoform X1 [Brassica napus]|uniref:uncharacterized protein LOC106451216 isoform X1 n=2 Tax=Brassica napus TaxID=3708 RepID=UPI000BBE417F|nr:uncharacterized protein LOC106451216 isoform X1 [Brassica napus]
MVMDSRLYHTDKRQWHQELPKVEHRMCARHVYGNLKKDFPKQPKMKKLFWQLVESHNKGDYGISLANIKDFNVDVYDGVMKRNPETFSRAYFKTTSTCEDALNNFSESYNSAIEKARALPLVEMLETIRRQAMLRIDIRKNESLKHKGKFSLKVGKVIAIEELHRKYCRIYPGPTGQFEVKEKSVSYKVNMKSHTCACRRWDLSGIPCRHALRVVQDKKTYRTEDLISHWYLTSTWQAQYSDNIKPMNGMKFWNTSGEETIEPPARDKSKGRKKNPAKRMKSVHESPTKGKKVTQHSRTMHCSRCGLADHNSLGCSNGGVPLKPRPPKKKAKTQQMVDSVSLDVGEGPSQPSLSSVTFD